MSYRAIAWAYDLPLRGPQKPVLVALADMADEANSCYPGQPRIADMTGLSVATVRRALDRLEQQGLISRQRRYDSFGHRTSDRYHLDLTVTVLESLPLTLRTDHSAQQSESQSLPLRESIPSAHSAQGTTRRTTRENHQMDITTVSPVTNVSKSTGRAQTDGFDQAVFDVASQCGIRNLRRLHRTLKATVKGPLSPLEAVTLTELVTNKALTRVADVDAYVAAACKDTPEAVRSIYSTGAHKAVA